MPDRLDDLVCEGVDPELMCPSCEEAHREADRELGALDETAPSRRAIR
jgi:hypothetical protein